MIRKLVVISDCTRECPHAAAANLPGTPSSATDYVCTKAKKNRDGYRLIVGYVEWDSERPKPGEFPKWCPLFEAEPGMFE